jgi:hypothetical protein
VPIETVTTIFRRNMAALARESAAQRRQQLPTHRSVPRPRAV